MPCSTAAALMAGALDRESIQYGGNYRKEEGGEIRRMNKSIIILSQSFTDTYDLLFGREQVQ